MKCKHQIKICKHQFDFRPLCLKCKWENQPLSTRIIKSSLAGAGLFLIGSAGLMGLGFIFSITIIGAIVGIPLFIMGLVGLFLVPIIALIGCLFGLCCKLKK